MTGIIPINSGKLAGEAVQTVNARDLHAFLEVQTAFKDWIVRRIEEYGFEQEKDFLRFDSSKMSDQKFCRSNLSSKHDTAFCSPNLGSKQGRGGHNRIDYHLSLDMAKELAMVEKTEKGREARRYFIDCERRAKAAAGARTTPLRSGRASAASRLVDAFLTECTTPDPDGLVPAGETYAAFLTWCQGKAVSRVPSSIAFGRRLKARGIQQEFDKRYYRWLGIALVPALPGRTAAIPPVAGFDATFARRISLLSADFYDSFRDAILRCDALYREHRMLLRDRFPRTVRDHDVDALLRQAEASGLSMIETASEALCAANHQMRSTERIYRLAIGCGK